MSGLTTRGNKRQQNTQRYGSEHQLQSNMAHEQPCYRCLEGNFAGISLADGSRQQKRMRSIANSVSVSVSLWVWSVCLSACISKTTCPNFTKFSAHVSVVMARSSSDDNAMSYVLPVLRMTPCFHIMGQIQTFRVCDVANYSP